jgi:hypothetical protein
VLFDDAAISMRYAENLAGGHGLRWNPGAEAVEGITNPLWTTWMAVPHLFGLPRSLTGLAVMISSSLMLLCCVVLAAGIARRLAPELRAAPPAAAVLTAASYPLAFWSLRGMEVGAVAAVALGALTMALDWADDPDGRRSTLHVIGALALVMMATRLDAAVLALTLMVWCVSRTNHAQRRRAIVVLGTWFLVGVAAMTAARLAYYGDLLPNTYYLKATGVPLGTRIDRGTRVFVDVAVISLVAPLAIAAGGVAWALARRRASVVALPVSMLTAQLAYSVWTGGDAWEDVLYANRYVATVLPLLAVLGGIGVAALAAFGRREFRPVALTVTGVAGLGCLMIVIYPLNAIAAAIAGAWQPWSGPLVATGVGLVIAGVGVGVAMARLPALRSSGSPHGRTVMVGLVTLGVVLAANGNAVHRWQREGPAYFGLDEAWAQEGVLINACTGPDTTVGVFAAGLIIYFADRPGVDLLGKSDRVIARMEPASPDFRPGHNKSSYQRSVAELRPDLLTDTGVGMPSDLLDIAERSGYDRVGSWLVRSDARGIDRDGLVRGMSDSPASCRASG